MNEKEVLRKIEELGKRLPHFPDGRINYTGVSYAPVITVFVQFKDKILLLKRSDKVQTYKGKWNTVAGYLDEVRPVREKVLEELREELDVGEDQIEKMYMGEAREYTDTDIGKTWLITPALVKLKSDKIRIDWEHTEYRWIHPEQIKEFDIVKDVDKSLKEAIAASAELI